MNSMPWVKPTILVFLLYSDFLDLSFFYYILTFSVYLLDGIFSFSKPLTYSSVGGVQSDIKYSLKGILH